MNYIIWKNNKKIIAGTTLRSLEEKEFGNLALHTKGDHENIIENRRKLASFCNTKLEQWVFPFQTHSDHIIEVKLEDAGKGSHDLDSCIPDCDAIYTRAKQLPLGVFHADCVPVLLHDPLQGIVCAIHSGWKSTVQEITGKAVHQLIDKEGCVPETIEAYIGPAISLRSFEVGSDVIERVKEMSFPTKDYMISLPNGKALVDTKGLNERMLLNAGLLKENITVDKNDTYTENDALFSYRRDHDCGRHVSFIMQK